MASASEWLRQGKTIAETKELIKSSMILSKIGVMDSKDATEKLTSTLNGFNLEAKNSMSIVDAVAKVDMIAATSSNELMTAYQRSASSAQEAGVTFQELTGYIATVSETTRRSASTTGESFDLILLLKCRTPVIYLYLDLRCLDLLHTLLPRNQLMILLELI